MRHHMNVTIPFVTLILVNIALVYAVRWQNRKTQCSLEGLDGSATGSKSRRREREKNSDSHNTASYHLFCGILTPLSHHRVSILPP